MNTKIALITGASRGLGRSMAVHLARAGVNVVGTYRERDDEARVVTDELRAIGVNAAFLRLDVSSMDDINAFPARLKDLLGNEFGRESFDFLINNAGAGRMYPFGEMPEAAFDALAMMFLKAPYFLTQGLLPLIADGGSIVNISSGLTRYVGPGYSAYATMKGGVEVLTRYMAAELGKRNITANVIAPGAIETDFADGRVRDNPAINAALAAQTALGRVGLPDDVGAAVAGLLVNSGHWINGTRIEVSGGQHL